MENTWVKCKVVLYVIFGILFLNSCSSPNNNKQKTPTYKAPTYQVYTVEIKGMKFVPDSITVNKGDEVVFVNRDMVAHCVTEDSNAWTSAAIPAGQSYLLVVKKSANYYCAIHNVMKGKIIMK